MTPATLQAAPTPSGSSEEVAHPLSCIQTARREYAALLSIDQCAERQSTHPRSSAASVSPVLGRSRRHFAQDRSLKIGQTATSSGAARLFPGRVGEIDSVADRRHAGRKGQQQKRAVTDIDQATPGQSWLLPDRPDDWPQGCELLPWCSLKRRRPIIQCYRIDRRHAAAE